MELIARCRAGDQQAWQELFELHAGFVYRTACHLGLDAEEARDVCQDTFRIAFEKLHTFTEGRLTTWLYRITANLVRHKWRRRHVRDALWLRWSPRTTLTNPSPAPDAVLQAQQARAIMAQILGRMSAKRREVFVLFEVEGLSGEEIAERTGAELNTVWTRLHHARQEFQRRAEHYRRELGLDEVEP